MDKQPLRANVTPEQHDALKEVAKARNCSTSAVLRALLEGLVGERAKVVKQEQTTTRGIIKAAAQTGRVTLR